ncbi:MAG: molybdopterin-binding protein [Coriobacteriales bacterium]|jgi:molybdopterin molybdotransferase
MRDHSKHIELTREEAVERMLEASGFAVADRALPVELVAIGESFGRVLARDVVSAVDVPTCLTCSMDSIAVHWSDFANGMPDTSGRVRGVDWDFANTGVAMPEGFDTAIVVEHAVVSDDEQHVSFDAAPSKQFAGTRQPGTRLKKGELLARAGQLITPDLASYIASGNIGVVPVVRKPRVMFIPTGNELVPPGAPDGDFHGRKAAVYARTIESNSILVHGKVEQYGGIYSPMDIVPDDRDAIRAAIALACETADIVVLNAGSSKGSDDWSCEVMEEMGEMICHETNHGPGHHSSFAVVDGTPIVGISGPPTGATYTLDFYLRPLVRAYLGQEPLLGKATAVLAAEFPQKKPHGHDHGKAKDAEPKKGSGCTAKGEQRPHMEKRVFHKINLVHVVEDENGVLRATPVAGNPNALGIDEANAIYLYPTGDEAVIPHVGDTIEIEYR